MKDSVLNKRISKSVISVLLCMMLALSFGGCSQNSPVETTTDGASAVTQKVQPEGSMTMPYTALDSMNPYFCTSVLNSSLVSLLYRSLYYTDNSFIAQRDIAEEENITGTTVTVSITKSLIFSDGIEITADDVLYSYELAKKSTLYSKQLSSVEKCEMQSSYRLIFTLSAPDVNVLSSLSFPIVKRGTAENTASLPVGSGCYAFSSEGGSLRLRCNMKYAGTLPQIGNIELYDIEEAASLVHLLDTGDIDCFYTDLSDSTAKRIYSSTVDIYLNNLIFIGVNQLGGVLARADIRKALSYALDRQRIVDSAFLGHARIAITPFNTSWEKITKSAFASSLPLSTDLKAADALMSAYEYGIDANAVNLTMIYVDGSSFIKNTAEFIAESFAGINVNLALRPLSYEEFGTELTAGDYNLYLSEIKLSKNMDLSPFFAEGGSASYGIEPSSSLAAAQYFLYRSGESDIDSFLKIFSEEMPFLPVCFRNGQFCYTRRMTGTVDASENRLFGNVSDWHFN